MLNWGDNCSSTVRVYLDAVEQLFGWPVDVSAGVITFSAAPAAGVQVTAHFDFDVPARFDTDQMAVIIQTFLHGWRPVPIVELGA